VRVAVALGLDLLNWMSLFVSTNPKTPKLSDWRSVYARVDTERDYPTLQRSEDHSADVYLSPPRSSNSSSSACSNGTASAESSLEAEENIPWQLCVELLNAGYIFPTKEGGSPVFSADTLYQLQVCW
jgi:hypothetical protein